MSKTNLGFKMPDSFYDTQRIIDNITASFGVWRNLTSDSTYIKSISSVEAMIAPYKHILQHCVPYETTRVVLEGAMKFQSLFADIQIPRVVDVQATIEKILPTLTRTWDPPIIDYDWARERLTEANNVDETVLSNLLTQELREELDESVREVIVSKNNTVESKYAEWKQKHPIIADIFLTIILGFFVGLASGVFLNWVTGVLTKPAKVYEEPKSTSKVVINVDVDYEVTIVNDIPYYFEIVYTNPENGEEKMGYISKRNIDIVDNNTDERE